MQYRDIASRNIYLHIFVVLGGLEGPVCDGLIQAFNSAESLRTPLVQQRQRVVAENDGKELTESNDPGMLDRFTSFVLIFNW